MVRKSLRSPRENAYYKQNKGGEDDDFFIMTSDFATKAAVTNNATPQANTDAQKEYDDFVSGLDDRQKNAIKVLDTWFQLKSSCVNQMAEMEAGNDALRDAVSRSKSARAPATNLTEKELGMKLGIGAASISYSDCTGKASDVEVKAFQKKITALEAELVEVRTELDRERSKGKKLKDASSTALKARKKNIESLKSKLRYYKKGNEALTQKVLLYKQALEEAGAGNHDAAATLPAQSVDSCEETVAASNTQKKEVTKDEKECNEPRSSPVRYDRNVLRKKMKSATSPVKASIRANEEKAEESPMKSVEDAANPMKSVEDASPEEREIIEVETTDHIDDTRDSAEEIEEEVTAEGFEPSVEEDSDLTFSEMMALGLPSATQAPKLRPKFKISSSGAFGSAPAIATPKTKVSEIKVADIVEKKEDGSEPEPNTIDNDEIKPSAFAMAMKNFSNGSASKPAGFKKNVASTAPPSVPALDDAKTSTEETSEENIDAVSTEAKEEGEKVEVSEEPLIKSSPVKSKIASLAESYGASVRAKRMSFERPPPTAPVSLRKESAPVPVKEDTSATTVDEEAVVMGSEAVPAAETIQVADDVAEVSTPSKESPPAVAASSTAGPGSAQKELEALRSMLKGRGGMANKKRFEMFEKKAE